MKKVFRITLALLLVAFVAIQFIRADRSTPEVDASIDFLNVETPPEAVTAIIKNTCYDCHSYQTNYPWYAHIAPISWRIDEHVEHGLEHLNFSLWDQYAGSKQRKILDEIAEEVEEGEMPLDDYIWLHSEADLTPEQRDLFMKWAHSRMQKR